jgi:prolyl-tRNA synthetase
MFGVPLRAEVGPREADSRTVTLVRRDTFEKSKADLGILPETVMDLFDAIQSNIAARAKGVMAERLTTANSVEELRALMEQKKLVRINWCGDVNCAERLKDQASGEIRGTLWDRDEDPTGPCIVCGDLAKSVAYVSRTY